jgi:hypothetical protein
MKLLLHACCAPCSIQCVEALAVEGLLPDLFWFNPNIHPYTEYRSRLDSLRGFAEAKKLYLTVEGEYGLRAFINTVETENLSLSNDFSSNSTTNQHEPTRTILRKQRASSRCLCGSWSNKLRKGSKLIHRCAFCYRLRLEKTARMASEKGYDAFSTTLLISPFQDHELIRKTGEEMASTYGIEFLYRDFRPRFREGQNQARAAGYYMQKYCGCIYSEEERYLTKRGEVSLGSQ